jgi:hypothetical protein
MTRCVIPWNDNGAGDLPVLSVSNMKMSGSSTPVEMLAPGTRISVCGYHFSISRILGAQSALLTGRIYLSDDAGVTPLGTWTPALVMSWDAIDNANRTHVVSIQVPGSGLQSPSSSYGLYIGGSSDLNVSATVYYREIT